MTASATDGAGSPDGSLSNLVVFQVPVGVTLHLVADDEAPMILSESGAGRPFEVRTIPQAQRQEVTFPQSPKPLVIHGKIHRLSRHEHILRLHPSTVVDVVVHADRSDPPNSGSVTLAGFQAIHVVVERFAAVQVKNGSGVVEMVETHDSGEPLAKFRGKFEGWTVRPPKTTLASTKVFGYCQSTQVTRGDGIRLSASTAANLEPPSQGLT